MTDHTLPPLNRAHLSVLVHLYEAGGSGDLDANGRVVVDTRHPVPGDAFTWVKLVSYGFVAGERGKMIVTELGREEAERVIAGRTVTA